MRFIFARGAIERLQLIIPRSADELGIYGDKQLINNSVNDGLKRPRRKDAEQMYESIKNDPLFRFMRMTGRIWKTSELQPVSKAPGVLKFKVECSVPSVGTQSCNSDFSITFAGTHAHAKLDGRFYKQRSQEDVSDSDTTAISIGTEVPMVHAEFDCTQTIFPLTLE